MSRKSIFAERLEIIDSSDLKKILSEFNIDPSQWSHNYGTKTINDLKNEIDDGEATLEIMDGELVRVIKVVSIQVLVELGDKLFTLAEDKQIFYSGAIRKRELKEISEKVKRYEPADSAVKRALKEEIGLNIEDINNIYLGKIQNNKPIFLPQKKEPVFLKETQEIKESPSYPGLDSLYKIFHYQIALDKEDLKSIRFYEIQEKKITLFSLEPI